MVNDLADYEPVSKERLDDLRTMLDTYREGTQAEQGDERGQVLQQAMHFGLDEIENSLTELAKQTEPS